MPLVKEFKLPDVGEGLTEGEIVRWMVAPGDTVVVNQNIVEVETAKVTVELPSPYAGVVTSLLYDEGATVDVGAPIIRIDTDPDGSAAEEPDTSYRGAVPTGQNVAHDEEEKPLVGYGAKATTAKRRARAATGEAPAATRAVPPRLVEPPRDGGMDPAYSLRTREGGDLNGVDRPRAKPPVRKYAKDLGIDLVVVVPTGQHGTITRADVERAASVRTSLAPTEPAAAPTAPAFDPATREQRVPIKGVRKATAAAMVSSAFTAPHVTEWLTIDITPTMKLRERLLAKREFAGVKLSPMVFVARALTFAAARHPMVNASWDEAAQEIVVKDYVNLGVAAATPRGLLVPNVKDAGRLSLVELAQAITSLTETAREGRTAPEAMSGGTITISNVGVFGVDTGTPILNPGEVAILAFGAIRPQPWVHKGKVKARQVTTLGLSFDHRVVDGELGSKFLADLGAILADPGVALTF